MRLVTLEELKQVAAESRGRLFARARAYGRDPKIYMHWSAGHYGQYYDDYHINIDSDGSIYLSTDDLAEVLAHTYSRNTGAVGVALACAYRADTQDLGPEPPTSAQIEILAQVIAVLCAALWLTLDRDHVMTHGEAADNIDGIYASDPYGPQSTCERWDLQYLGTDESPSYTTDYDDPATGGNVLRGKALWYQQH